MYIILGGPFYSKYDSGYTKFSSLNLLFLSKWLFLSIIVASSGNGSAMPNDQNELMRYFLALFYPPLKPRAYLSSNSCDMNADSIVS